MSTPVIQQGVEKPQLASIVDAKEDVEYVDTTVNPIVQEHERMATYEGPKASSGQDIAYEFAESCLYIRTGDVCCARERDRLDFVASRYVTAGLHPVGCAHLVSRSEWNTDPVRPPSPAYFRFLYMGKMLSDEQTLAGLDLKVAPATTIIHLSVRTIPPEEENTKKSLLGFSLRPSIRGRASSSNVPTTTPGAANNPTSHGAPPPASVSVPQPQIAAAAPNAVASRSAGRTSAQQSTTAEPSSRSRPRAAAADDGTHGTGASGGCKCVIM
ncbi:hypothetical protein QFC20_002030 [Naganishia adeliensis]|uniref:Uncharacterized protein n=1 Tax=Naganishia adeliensis TaxID=92952 RepID=A0ACC2WMZ8_9TREE|nr:hypothetical protein QFC20_002030 [Naganishia adeliensis]